jgi:hypothetical protein
VTIARSLSDTSAGIAPAGIAAFIAVQLPGAAIDVMLSGWLWKQPPVKLLASDDTPLTMPDQ